MVRVRKHFNKKLSRSIMENENICDINLLVIDVAKKLEKKIRTNYRTFRNL